MNIVNCSQDISTIFSLSAPDDSHRDTFCDSNRTVVHP